MNEHNGSKLALAPTTRTQRGDGRNAGQELGAWVLSRLLCGEDVGELDLAKLPSPYPYGALAMAIRDRRNGTDARAVFEAELGRLLEDVAREIRNRVFASDPHASVPPPAKVRGMTASELLSAKLPPLRWTVDGLIIRPGLTILGGAPKVGKSWLSLQIARAVALGEPLLSRPVSNGGRVVYFALEDGPSRLQARLRQASWTGMEDAIFLFGDDLPPLDDGGLDTLEVDIVTWEPALVVLDSLAAAKTKQLDENEAGDIAELSYRLSRLASNYDLSILIVHHHRKLTTGSPLSDLRGSGALGGAADGILALYRERGEPECKLGLDSRDVEGGDWALGFTGCGWTLLGGGEVIEQRKSERGVAKALRSLGPEGGTVENVIHAVGGMRRQDAYAALQALVDQGVAESEEQPHEGKGKARKVYRFIGGS